MLRNICLLTKQGRKQHKLVWRGAFGFLVLVVIAVCGFFVFLASGFRFLWKNTSGFSVLVPDVVFGFFYFVLFWVPISVRFEQHLISNSREMPKLFRGMRDKINVMVVDQASPLTPGETLTSQTRATIWSVCELWLPTCLPRQQQKNQLWIVVFFYEGKGGENFRKKNKCGKKLQWLSTEHCQSTFINAISKLVIRLIWTSELMKMKDLMKIWTSVKWVRKLLSLAKASKNLMKVVTKKFKSVQMTTILRASKMN